MRCSILYHWIANFDEFLISKLKSILTLFNMINSLLGDNRNILLIVNLMSMVIFKDVIDGVLSHYRPFKGYIPQVKIDKWFA